MLLYLLNLIIMYIVRLVYLSFFNEFYPFVDLKKMNDPKRTLYDQHGEREHRASI